MQRIAITLSHCLVSGLTLATRFKGAVSSSMAGVICDKKAGFCVDSQGISMGLTKQYLGPAATKKPLVVGAFDTSTFVVLTNGVSCKASGQKCAVSKFGDKADAAHTKALFGK